MVTPEALPLVHALHQYQFLPSPTLHEIVGGDRSTRYRQIRTLYDLGYINRFVFPKVGKPLGQLYHYLDNPAALDLLYEHNLIDEENLDRDKKRVLRNREKGYAKILDPNQEDRQGSLLHLQHEVMISRFQSNLEIACRNSSGEVQLGSFVRGADLWDEIHGIKKVKKYKDQQGIERYIETETKYSLPLRPDAFFSLIFPSRPEWCRTSFFFYEADRRSTTNTNRINLKWRAYFWAIRVSKYFKAQNIRKIRVLCETTTPRWAETLRRQAATPYVSPKPSPLFWFTSQQELTRETIFDPIFKTPYSDEQRHSLLDP